MVRIIKAREIAELGESISLKSEQLNQQQELIVESDAQINYLLHKKTNSG